MESKKNSIPLHFLEAMESSSLTLDERIKRLYQHPGWTNSIDDWLAYKPFVMPTDAEDSLDQLVEWYVNKKSKRVNYAGSRLRKAFLTLPPADQRKVGLALLTGGKTDTEWVCARLLNYKPAWNKEWNINWHPCYAEAVEAAWKKYKSKNCGKLLIYFLDPAIVRQNMEELAKDDDELYVCLCQRFVGEPWFHVDDERLYCCTYINEYFSVMSQTKEGISDETAEALLYQWIGAVAALFKERSSWMHQYRQNFWRSNVMEHRVIYSWGIDTALYYLLKMNKHRVVTEFLAWDQKVYLAYYSRLNTEHDSPKNSEKFIDCILTNFPKKYSRFTRLNTGNYIYAKSPGVIYGRPKKLMSDYYFFGSLQIYLDEDCTQQFKNSHPEEKKSISPMEAPSLPERKEMAQENFLKMANKNPNLQKLVEAFGLTIANSSENENFAT